MKNQCKPIMWEELTEVLFDDGIVIETGEINLEEIEYEIQNQNEG